ncbi:hypothetical protein BDZ94DRAFT_323207 [Collybia nuda]|uniref:Secreted protein n=1 Tax=Collybia nuda TaxID=64659 RepID=A0A9P5YCV5_9AGAR|nr:hypothetical protein BDZ94DRAFT_323207 [Collybia nuda]
MHTFLLCLLDLTIMIGDAVLIVSTKVTQQIASDSRISIRLSRRQLQVHLVPGFIHPILVFHFFSMRKAFKPASGNNIP